MQFLKFAFSRGCSIRISVGIKSSNSLSTAGMNIKRLSGICSSGSVKPLVEKAIWFKIRIAACTGSVLLMSIPWGFGMYGRGGSGCGVVIRGKAVFC